MSHHPDNFNNVWHTCSQSYYSHEAKQWPGVAIAAFAEGFLHPLLPVDHNPSLLRFLAVTLTTCVCGHLEKDIYPSRDIYSSWDVVRTYISRDICPHYILLRFSALDSLLHVNIEGTVNCTTSNFHMQADLWKVCYYYNSICSESRIISIVPYPSRSGKPVILDLSTWFFCSPLNIKLYCIVLYCMYTYHLLATTFSFFPVYTVPMYTFKCVASL